MWTTRAISSRPWASRSFSRSRGARAPPPGPLLLMPCRARTLRVERRGSRVFPPAPSSQSCTPFLNSQLKTHKPSTFLELQAALAGRIGQRLDLPVIDVAAAIEHDATDPLFSRALRDQLPDPLPRRDVGVHRALFLEAVGERRRVSERLSRAVVDDLGIDVAAAFEDGQSRTRGAAPNLLSDSNANPAACVDSVFRFHGYLPPAFPTLRRMNSSAYLIPFAL